MNSRTRSAWPVSVSCAFFRFYRNMLTFFASLVLFVPTAHAIQYSISPYSSFANSSGAFNALNNNGVSVGFYLDNNTGLQRAFKSDGTTAVDLGSLASFGDNATGVNNHGVAVGSSIDANFKAQAIKYSGGTLIQIGAPAGYDRSNASDINDVGQITGATFGNDLNTATGYVYNPDGTFQVIGKLGYSTSKGTAINASGQVAGLASNGFYGKGRAFIWDNGTMTNLGLPAVANTGAEIAAVTGINDQGWVVGSWQNPGTNTNRRGFLYRNGVMEDLFQLDPSVTFSDAVDINNLGQIVGRAQVNGVNSDFGFLWDNGTMYNVKDLVDPGSGWVLTSAQAINDKGQIVGFGYLNGVPENYILTPTLVPVPAALPLMITGLLSLFGIARRKSQ